MRRFLYWLALNFMWRQIPEMNEWASFAGAVSRTPIWLRDRDPFENHPFTADPFARLPEEVDVVVIGAGMAGSAAAYHWSKNATAGQMLVLEMNSVASGSGSGVSFNGAHHVVKTILGLEGPDYYPVRFFSAKRFQT